MVRAKSLLALAVVTAAVAAGAVLVLQQESEAIPRSGEPLFPGLLARVNEAARIETVSKEATVVVELRDGHWVVPDRHGYPAAQDNVHQLLVGAAGLERIEPKTANRELWSKIGVEPPDAEGATSVRYRVTDAAGAELASLVVGKRDPAKAHPDQSEIYVRAGDDPRAWLVEGRLPLARTARDWLDQTVAAIERPRIRRVEIVHPDDEQVVVERSDPFGEDYTLVGVPEGMDLTGQWHVNDVGRLVEELKLDDVRPAEGYDPAPGRDVTVEIATFDGLRIRVETSKDGDALWATLEARLDDAEPPAFDAASGAEDEAQRKQREEKLAALRSREDVEAEVERLNRRWAGWVYRLPEFKANYLAQRMQDLIKPREEEEKAKEGNAGQG